MASIRIADLKEFAVTALINEGMSEAYAEMCADSLVETDAFGVHSHGTKNLYNYIKKLRCGGVNINAEPIIKKEGPSFAVINANDAMGMIPATLAMKLACEKARKTGIAIVTVINSCHFGAAGYYANIAALQGMVGICMSNVDPNMTAPGARGMVIGNNPFAYSVPGKSIPSYFLDIAMSNVASLKVIQARKDGHSVPDTWIVDKDGLPTTDPSHYPEEGAMQPMAAHKGYGIAVMVDVLTGLLADGEASPMGGILSWCFVLEQVNKACHTCIAIDADQFSDGGLISSRVEAMAEKLHNAPKAKGSERIYMPGEIEWAKHKAAEENGINLPADVLSPLMELSREIGVSLPIRE